MIEKYRAIRSETEKRCRPLQEGDYMLQPIEDVSPAKWHLAHTTWFFEAFVLKKFFPQYKEFNAGWSLLFNSYYEHEGERISRFSRGSIGRPSVAEVYEYRKYVDKFITQLLGENLPEVNGLVELGLNHEQQHQELLLTDIKYSFWVNPLKPVYENSLLRRISATQKWISISEGIYAIGSDGSTFCYDNELKNHRVFLDHFEISNIPVTQGEYIEFMRDSGYERFELWLSEGWEWVVQNRVKMPQYWTLKNGEYHQFTLGGIQKVDPEAAMCHVNFYEADAFARWRGMRLPTEFEWEVASSKIEYGGVWEWTNSAYLPYPGFEIAAGAIGEYNGKWMVNQMVLRGESSATPKGHSRPTYRNFFHADKRWQYSGIRLVKKQRSI